MNGRERILGLAAMAMTLATLGYFIVAKSIVWPAAEAKKNAIALELSVEKLAAQVDMGPEYEKRLWQWAMHGYGADPLHASESARAHLVELLQRSGLRSDRLSMTPVDGQPIRGGREIGWLVKVAGSHNRLINFIYLLNADPHLHRLDSISWTPVPDSTDLMLQFKFATLVLERPTASPPTMQHESFMVKLATRMFHLPTDKQPVETDQAKLVNNAKTDDRKRKQYALIETRDIFRPYIKRPPPPPPTRTVQRPETNRNEPPPRPPKPDYVVVALASWGGNPEVTVKNTLTGKSQIHKIGEDLMGGEIMMVDYRPMPMPRKPKIISTSRVIVRVGREYWAVELGNSLDDKHRLTSRQLPPALQALQVAPAGLQPKPETKNPKSSGPARTEPSGKPAASKESADAR